MKSQLASLIKAFRSSETSELEVVISERGEKGISFEPFEKLFDLLNNWAEKGHIELLGSKVVKDFFYHQSIRSRCIIGFEDENITKTKIHSIHAKCPERKHVEFHFTLKDEVPLNEPIAMNNEAIEVRVYLLWEYECKNLFRYSLKQVQTGKGVEHACRNEIHYEVEIEVIRGSELLKQFSDDELAEKLIEKSLDLVGRTNKKTRMEDKLTMDLFSAPNEKRKKETEPKRKYVSKKSKAITQEVENTTQE